MRAIFSSELLLSFVLFFLFLSCSGETEVSASNEVVSSSSSSFSSSSDPDSSSSSSSSSSLSSSSSFRSSSSLSPSSSSSSSSSYRSSSSLSSSSSIVVSSSSVASSSSLAPINPRDSILQYIDDNWQELGYSDKPTKYVALTFDDGPAGASTKNLLEALSQKNVKATFFLIGQNIRSQGTWAKAIYDAGHELANHSDGYNGLGGDMAQNIISASLSAASAEIKKITGKNPNLFRAPNVEYGNNLTNVCAQQGLAIIGVSIWSNDYQSNITAATIADNVLKNPTDGGIINMHEPNTAPNSVSALPDIIDGLRKKGFWITTVGELAIIKNKSLQAGVRYDEIK